MVWDGDENVYVGCENIVHINKGEGGMKMGRRNGNGRRENILPGPALAIERSPGVECLCMKFSSNCL
jgi:hypothetical protein